MVGWETRCEDCGVALVPDPDWKDERHCYGCNLVYLHPDTVAMLERRLDESRGAKTYTAAELGEMLGVDL